MTKLYGFNSSTNKPTLLNVDTLNLLELSTDYPLTVPSGRLSLSSTDPLGAGTDQTILYYLPYNGDVVPFWDKNNSRWVYRAIPDAGLSLDMSGFGIGNFDIYALSTSTSLYITSQGWSTNTSRSTQALTRKHGIYTLDFTGGDLRTYLGTIRTTGTAGAAKLQDGVTQRYVFNAYHRVAKRIVKLEATASWTTTTTWRAYNNNTANRIEVVDGLGTTFIDLNFMARISPASGNFGAIGIGIDANNPSDSYTQSIASDTPVSPRCVRSVGLGYHYIQACEASGNTGQVVTFYSSGYCGLQGVWSC